jgi:hypothetical protein
MCKSFPCIIPPHLINAHYFNCRISQNRQGNEYIRSFGDGIERETSWALFEAFRNQSSQWFLQRMDNHASVATTHPLSSSQYVPSSRLRNLQILGAISALLLVQGIAPSNLDPVMLNFFVHSGDLHCIHPTWLGEWHPRLRATILGWINMGASGDLAPFQSHFASYHDMEVSTTSLSQAILTGIFDLGHITHWPR